jgi:hypothetical protein
MDVCVKCVVVNRRLAPFIVAAVLSSSAVAIESAREGVVDSQSRFVDHQTETLQPHLASEVTYGVADGLPQDAEFSADTLKKLMRPNLTFASEWQSETNDMGLAFHDAGISFPTYPWFGPPPPLINLGFAFTDIDAPPAAGLPHELYETELGLAWMRRINDRWMMRYMASVSFATDGNNHSSDAWRFRGGVFALYRHNPHWTWTFGAIALGRNDLPVVPALGVIHQPNPAIRFDLIMPRPRLSFLLADRGARQQWGYIGAALHGATWGVQRGDGVDDQLTYGDFRVVLGWESTPTPEQGMPFTRGRKLGAEIGYVFSRDFEWEDDDVKIPLDDALMMRATFSF